MNLIDSHCHINSKELLPNVNEIVERANKSEVKNFIIVGCDLDDSILALNLAYCFISDVFLSRLYSCSCLYFYIILI